MNRKGFTLVELMIVCSIIGLLAAVFIPMFEKIRDKNKERQAKVPKAAKEINLTTVKTYNTPKFIVEDFYLQDGTRCMAITHRKNAATASLSCDWGK